MAEPEERQAAQEEIITPAPALAPPVEAVETPATPVVETPVVAPHVAPASVLSKPAGPSITKLDVPPVTKVVIDDRSYFIRSAEGDRPVEIAEVIALTKAAAGDSNGIRVIVYRKGTSRPSAENALQDAFNEAKISDTAIFWVPTTTE